MENAQTYNSAKVRIWKDVDLKKTIEVQELFEALGVRAEIEMTGYGHVHELILTRGRKSIRLGSGFTIKAIQPNTTKLWRLEGQLRGLPVKLDFADQAALDESLGRMTSGLSGEDFKLEANEVEVEV